MFLYPPTKVLRILQSLGKSRKGQKSSLISEEKVNKRLAIKFPEFSKFYFSEGRKWGVRSVVVEFAVFGAPRFSVQKPQNPLKIGISVET